MAKRGFPESEFEARLDRAHRLMAEAGIDALLLTTEENVRYFTGFLTKFWLSPTRPWFLVVPLHKKPVAVIPSIGAECMARTWIEDIRTWPSPQPDDDGVSLLARTLAECVGGGTIGIPMGRETTLRAPLASFEDLKSQMRGASFVDATPIISQLRIIKSKLEIEKIAHACAATSRAFQRFPTLICDGMTDVDMFREFTIECLRQGVDDVPYLVGASAPGGYRDIISPPTGRVMQRGDLAMLDAGCVFDGYFCDFDRNFALGDASDEAKRAYRVVYEATEAGINAAKPGTTCRDLYTAMAEILTEGAADEGSVGRLGHGLGMQLTEWPSHAPFDTTVLQPGMVLTIEPSKQYGEGYLMVHEENIVITEEGARLLTERTPPELPVIDW